MKDTCLLVTTFLRDACLFRCVESIRKHYPDIPIYVGDNGYHTKEKEDFCKEYTCEYIKLEFDLGVGGTRNEAIRRIPRKFKYLIIVEDDIVFTDGTKLENWHRILQDDPQIGIVGGLLKKSDKEEQHYEGNHRIEGDTKFTDKATDPKWIKLGKLKYFLCDLVLNVFMMRLDVWRGENRQCPEPIQWDPQFKTALEHSDFFINVKYALKGGKPVRRRKAWHIAYTRDVWMYHKHEIPTKKYADFRCRTVGFELFGRKWGLEYSYSDYNGPQDNPVMYLPETIKKRKDTVYDQLLTAAIKALDRLGVKWWLTSGSCLGAIREKGFIKHDPDIDFGIAPGQLNQWDAIKEEFRKQGFSLYKEWKYQRYKIELSFVKYGIKVDVFFFYKRGKKYWYGAFGPDKRDRWGSFMQLIPRSFPATLYKNPKEIDFRGHKCLVPNPPEEYLELMYGKDWQVPKKDWKYWKDCKAADNSLFDSSKIIFIPGTWEKIGIEELDILEAVQRFGGKLHIGIYSDGALRKAGYAVNVEYEKRKRIAGALRITDKTMRLNSFDPGRDFQKIGYVPDCMVIPEEDKGKGYAEYVEAFGGAVFTINEFQSRADRHIIVEKMKPPEADKSRIAIGIKTFLREDNFFKTIQAIQKNVAIPHKLYIADDGFISEEKRDLYKRLEDAGHKILELPFNSGISVGRNSIIKHVEEDYVLIMDDDIKIQDSTAIENIKKVLDSRKDIGLVAGTISLERSGQPFGNRNYSRGIDFEIKNGVLYRHPASSKVEKFQGVSYRIADQVVNFFLAKRKVFDDVRWDSSIKIEYEHMDFFLELKETKWKAAVCLDAEVIHLHPKLGDFEYDRYRRSAPVHYFAQKHGIAPKIINRWH